MLAPYPQHSCTAQPDSGPIVRGAQSDRSLEKQHAPTLWTARSKTIALAS